MYQTSSFKFGDRVVHAARPEWGPGTVVRVESVHEQGRPAQRLQIRFPGVGLKVINTAVASIVSAENMPSILDESKPVKPEVPTPVVQTTRHANAEATARAASTSNGVSSNTNSVASPASADRESSSKPASAHAMPPARKPNTGDAPFDSDAPRRNGWLSSLEQKNPSDLMVRIPDAANDRFRSVWDRLKTTLDLYRFKAEPRSMTDWAVAQSGIEDPLTMFNRQELETLFAKWTRLRDSHLTTLVEEAEREERGGEKARSLIRTSGHDAAKQALRRFDARR